MFSLRLLILVLLSVVALAKEDAPPAGMCERIHPEDLPEECTCREPRPLGLLIECRKVFNSTWFNDTIGMAIDIDPCNEMGSSMSINITEFDHGINYRIAGVRAGEEQYYPIPGCSIIVPVVGSMGLDADVLIYGNPDQLTIKVGLNACTVVASHTICASSVPGLNAILPWWILSGTYSFGDVCETKSTMTPTTTTTTTTTTTAAIQ